MNSIHLELDRDSDIETIPSFCHLDDQGIYTLSYAMSRAGHRFVEVFY